MPNDTSDRTHLVRWIKYISNREANDNLWIVLFLVNDVIIRVKCNKCQQILLFQVASKKSGGLFSDGTESDEDALFGAKPTTTVAPKKVSRSITSSTIMQQLF